jgi:hypothetical protein
LNLRGIANNAIQAINPNISVVVRLPNGYSIDPLTRKQVPTYIDTPAQGQLQALDGDDLKQIAGLNIQGAIRAMYLYGSVAGVIRPDGSSQSHVVFTSNEAGVTKSREWGVFKVLESWQTWCKVAIVYQESAP